MEEGLRGSDSFSHLCLLFSMELVDSSAYLLASRLIASIDTCCILQLHTKALQET